MFDVGGRSFALSGNLDTQRRLTNGPESDKLLIFAQDTWPLFFPATGFATKIKRVPLTQLSAMYNQISCEKVGSVHVVTFNANRVMDPIMIEEIGSELQKLFDEYQGQVFLLDMKNVEFLSSAVLNRLIVLDKSVKTKNGSLAFCNLGPAVNEVFAITKLDLLFKIFENQSSAIDELG